MLFLLALFNFVVTEPLFAGNGIITTSYSWLHPEIIQTNCTTYDDCLDLLCFYLFQPIYRVSVVVNNWNKNCSELNMDDNRTLESIMTNSNNVTYTSYTVSMTSWYLCSINKFYPNSPIDYIPINCDFN